MSYSRISSNPMPDANTFGVGMFFIGLGAISAVYGLHRQNAALAAKKASAPNFKPAVVPPEEAQQAANKKVEQIWAEISKSLPAKKEVIAYAAWKQDGSFDSFRAYPSSRASFGRTTSTQADANRVTKVFADAFAGKQDALRISPSPEGLPAVTVTTTVVGTGA